MKIFEFIFQGNQEQFEFFKKIACAGIHHSGLFLDFIQEDEFHCSMSNDPNKIFKMGMIVSACYAKFGQLQESVFANN